MPKTKTRARTKAARPRKSAKPRSKPRSADELTKGGPLKVRPELLEMQSARQIAKSLKEAAERSDQLSSSPFHSALSVLNHLIGHLELQKARLEAAKKELRSLYGEDDKHEGGEPHPPKDYARMRGGPAEKGAGAPNDDMLRKRARRGKQPKSS
jgi:hypothetical protein